MTKVYIAGAITEVGNHKELFDDMERKPKLIGGKGIEED